MGSILEELHKANLDKATRSLEFSNAGAASDISRKFIGKYKDAIAKAGGSDASILKELRAKNLARANQHIDFSNDLAQSNISRKYNEKYKASLMEEKTQGNASSLLESLRKKNMDATTEKM